MLTEVGEVTQVLVTGLGFLLKGKIDFKALVDQFARIGVDSLPVALIICSIAGCVLTLHGSQQFAQSGAQSYIGGLVAITMVRELAPIFTALAVAARAGTGIAAEIANMKTSSQLDALHVLQVNPIRYLLIPRLLALFIAMPMMTILTMAIGILGGMITAKATIGLHYLRYLDSVWVNLKVYDIQIMIFKAAVFGIVLAAVAVTCGLESKNSAKDVGLAATHATIWSSIAVLVLDFLMTWMFFGTSLLS